MPFVLLLPNAKQTQGPTLCGGQTGGCVLPSVVYKPEQDASFARWCGNGDHSDRGDGVPHNTTMVENRSTITPQQTVVAPPVVYDANITLTGA